MHSCHFFSSNYEAKMYFCYLTQTPHREKDRGSKCCIHMQDKTTKITNLDDKSKLKIVNTLL